MPDVACKSSAALRPLGPGISTEVRDWVRELRVIWAATGLSMNQFACLHPIDKGTLSRYLNGQRVPRDHWFLDRLLAIQADSGKPVLPAVRQHLEELQLRALETAHPHEYRVRMVSDKLEIALTAQREAQRYADALEARLVELHGQIQDLTSDKNRLRTAWDADRTARQAEYDGLTREIGELTEQLYLARERAVHAEQRCQFLEDIIDQLDSNPSQEADNLGAHLPPCDFDDPTYNIDALARALDDFYKENRMSEAALLAELAADPDALARALDNFDIKNRRRDAALLAEWIASYADVRDPRKLARLLLTMRMTRFIAHGRRLAVRVVEDVRLEDLSLINISDLKFLLIGCFGVAADDVIRRLAPEVISIACVRSGSKDEVRAIANILHRVGSEKEAKQLAHQTNLPWPPRRARRATQGARRGKRVLKKDYENSHRQEAKQGLGAA